MRAVLADVKRHWRHFAAASVGIVLGVAALTFFLALGLKVREVLLVQVFPSDHLEVAPRSSDLDLFALRLDLGRDTLGRGELDDLAAIDGVSAVYPRMRLTVPALASGGSSLFGAGMQTEIVADGVDPALVADELGDVFTEIDLGGATVPCSKDTECGDASYCEGASGFGGTGVCRPYVPVLVSPYVVELYNGAFRRAYDLPKVNPDALRGMVFEMHFGASSFKRSTGRPIRSKMRLAGVSERAIPLGVTLPLGYISWVNATLDAPEAGERYHSAILGVASKEAVPGIVEAVEGEGLEVRDRGARRAALVTSVLMFVLALVGVALIALSAAHIMHVFSLIVMIRRREIGLLRALGARRSDIRVLLLAEAALVGAAAAVLGVLLAFVGGWTADWLAASRVPDFPFKPESFFFFSPLVVGAVLILAVAACAVGALPPTLRAASGDPSDTLAGR
jgi:hypothetical protein